MSAALAAYEVVHPKTNAKDWPEFMKSYDGLEREIAKAKNMELHVGGIYVSLPYFSGDVVLPLSAKDEVSESIFKEKFSTDLRNAADELEKKSYWDVWKGTFRHYLGVRARYALLPMAGGAFIGACVYNSSSFGGPLGWVVGFALGLYAFTELDFSLTLKNNKKETVRRMRDAAGSIEVLYVQDSFKRTL